LVGCCASEYRLLVRADRSCRSSPASGSVNMLSPSGTPRASFKPALSRGDTGGAPAAGRGQSVVTTGYGVVAGAGQGDRYVEDRRGSWRGGGGKGRGGWHGNGGVGRRGSAPALAQAMPASLQDADGCRRFQVWRCGRLSGSEPQWTLPMAWSLLWTGPPMRPRQVPLSVESPARRLSCRQSRRWRRAACLTSRSGFVAVTKSRIRGHVTVSCRESQTVPRLRADQTCVPLRACLFGAAPAASELTSTFRVPIVPSRSTRAAATTPWRPA